MKINELRYNGASYQGYSPDELKEIGVPDSVIQQAVSEQELSSVIDARMLAYKSESDPMFIEWQNDNTPEKEQAWRDKVAEIKARYPLPSAS